MNILLDCGFYMGLALQKYIDVGTVDKTWKIYAFEPNPDLKSEQKIKDFFEGYNIRFIKKAVWIKDGTVKFHISGREGAASIEGTSGHTEPKEVVVKSIDFSKFVADLPKAYIYCSMDIEGAEFLVLKKMLVERTIDRINVLDIEFHHRLMNGYDPGDASALIKEVEDRGVKVILKDNLI